MVFTLLRARIESLLRFGFGFMLAQTLLAFWPDALLYKTLYAIPWLKWSSLRIANAKDIIPSGVFLAFLVFVLMSVSVSALLLMQSLRWALFTGESGGTLPSVTVARDLNKK